MSLFQIMLHMQNQLLRFAQAILDIFHAVRPTYHALQTQATRDPAHQPHIDTLLSPTTASSGFQSRDLPAPSVPHATPCIAQ